MRMTETARQALTHVLKENPGKVLRVVFRGFG